MQPAPGSPAPPATSPQRHGPAGPEGPTPAFLPIDKAGGAGGPAAAGSYGMRSGVWRVRAGTGALWLLIALAAAGGLRSLFSSGPAHPTNAATMASAAASAAGFAQLFVATYLESGAGQAGRLHRFYPGPIDLAGVTPEARYASRTAAVSVVPLGAGSWSITVAADVLVAAQGGYVRAGTQDYEVGVTTTRSGMVATSLPSLIAAPPAANLPALAAEHLAAPGHDAATRAVAGFLDAYLTGRDVTSTAAGALAAGGIRPITPTPFASVQLTGVAWPAYGGGRAGTGTRLVLAEVSATDSIGFTQVLEYTLQIDWHGNHWLVRQILPAGALDSGTGIAGR